MKPRAAVYPLICALLLTQCGDRTPTPTPPVPDLTAALPQGVERVRIGASGQMLGRLEPCGCASGQIGGLARRFFQIDLIRGFDLLLEGGNVVSGGNELDLKKYEKSVEILFGMKRPYDALGIGPRDLMLDLDELCALLGVMQVPAVASDLECTVATWPVKPFVDKVVRDQKVRIASFTCELPEALRGGSSPIKLLPPKAGWQRAMQDVDPAALRIAMWHGDSAAAFAVLKDLQPAPDLLLFTNDDHSEPPAHPTMQDNVAVAYTGIRGRMLLDLTIARVDGAPRCSYHVLKLEGSRTAKGALEDADVKAAIVQHRHEVANDNVLQKLANQRPTSSGASYVGSDKCASCHAKAWEIWNNSKHANAWETLVRAETDPDRYGWPTTKYPDCVACHVVGYGEKSGFVDPVASKGLEDVGCEQCHGPASEHVQSGGTSKLGRVGAGSPSTVCSTCHDFEQSPTFDYLQRWKLIEHGK